MRNIIKQNSFITVPKYPACKLFFDAYYDALSKKYEWHTSAARVADATPRNKISWRRLPSMEETVQFQ